MSPELWGIVSGVLGAGASLTGLFVWSRSSGRVEEDEIPSDDAADEADEADAEPDGAAEPTPQPDAPPPGAPAPTGVSPFRAVRGATRSYRGRLLPRRRRPAAAPGQAWTTTIVSAAVSGAVGAGVGGIITWSLN